MTTPNQRILQRIKGGDALSARDLFNPLIDAVNQRAPRTARLAADANQWVPCISDDDFDAYSVMDAYDSFFENGGIVFRVRKADSTTQLWAANEKYPLFAEGSVGATGTGTGTDFSMTHRGWVKIIPCSDDGFVVAKAVGQAVLFDDALDVSDTFVESQAGGGTGSGSGTGTTGPGSGPLVALSDERDGDRLVNVALNCKEPGVPGDLLMQYRGTDKLLCSSFATAGCVSVGSCWLVDYFVTGGRAPDTPVIVNVDARWFNAVVLPGGYFFARQEGDRYFAVKGGTINMTGVAAEDISAGAGLVTISGPFGSADVYCGQLCGDQIVTEGTAMPILYCHGTVSLSSPFLMLDPCCLAGGTGTGSGSG